MTGFGGIRFIASAAFASISHDLPTFAFGEVAIIAILLSRNTGPSARAHKTLASIRRWNTCQGMYHEDLGPVTEICLSTTHIM